jgi:hypothetical protein
LIQFRFKRTLEAFPLFSGQYLRALDRIYICGAWRKGSLPNSVMTVEINSASAASIQKMAVTNTKNEKEFRRRIRLIEVRYSKCMRGLSHTLKRLFSGMETSVVNRRFEVDADMHIKPYLRRKTSLKISLTHKTFKKSQSSLQSKKCPREEVKISSHD